MRGRSRRRVDGGKAALEQLLVPQLHPDVLGGGRRFQGDGLWPPPSYGGRVFNKQFFDKLLSELVGEKSSEDSDGEQASVLMTLFDGSELKLAGMVPSDDGWVVARVYPESGKPRAFKRDKADRGPRVDLDQVAIVYSAIRCVRLTLDKKKHDAGFVV